MSAQTLRFPEPAGQPDPPSGLAVLAQLVRQQSPHAALRPAAEQDPLTSLFQDELRLGLGAADAERAYEAAAALRRRSAGSAACHDVISRVLQDVGTAWSSGTRGIVDEHRITATAALVLARLPRPAATRSSPPVILAVPPGERHVLALSSLADCLAEAGHATDVVGDLPPADLARAARHAPAVVLSVHVRSPDLNALLAAVRAAAPRTLLVVGGPAAPSGAQADLVTQDLDEMVAAVDLACSPLTEREREVLSRVADGLSNQEAAEVLGILPATVKTHLDHIFHKTGASGRAGAVASALRHGWIR